MKNFFILSLLFLFTYTPVTYSANAETKLEPRVIYKKKTTVDFSDAIVEGEVQNPEGIYVVTPPEKKFGSLLKLRPNFHKELMRDALLLK